MTATNENFKQNPISEAIDAAVSKLRPQDIYTDKAHNFKVSGDRLRGGCAWHKSKSGTSFVVTQSSMEWYCAGCGFGGGPIQYLHRVQGGDGKPRGDEFIDIARELCRKAGVDFPECEVNPAGQERYNFLSQRSALLGNIIEFCQSQIRDEHRDYFHQRGFTATTDISELAIGFYDVASLRKHLAGCDKKLLESCGVLWNALDGYLVFPWYDDRKRPLTLYFKWPSKTPPEGKPKTIALPNPKLDGKEVLESKYVPYCFERTTGEKDLVLVEGVTDAALAQVRGDRRVVACVAAQLSKGQVDTLKRHRVESVTICLDPDEAGENGIRSCVKSLEEAGIKPLIAPKLPDDLDPDEFIIKYGIDAWKAHIAAAKTPLQVEIDAIAETKPDLSLLKLSALLEPLKPKLAKLPGTELEGYLNLFKNKTAFPGVNARFVEALRQEIQEIKKATQPGDTETKSTLQSLQTVPRIHPAIDFHEGFMTLGFRVDQDEDGDCLLLILSDSHQVKALVNPEEIECGGRTYRVRRGTPAFINGVWDLDSLRDFVQNSDSQRTLFGDLKRTFQTYLDMQEHVYGLMAAWVIGTFFAHLFTAFPFLHFHGPKECGKSKTLEALRCVCFNAWKGRDITAAALGDTTDGQRGTLLLDQAEKLDGSPENGGNLIGLLADSYKKAGAQRRVVEITKAGRSTLEFSCYGPKAFASTKSLDPDLADRCVRIPMTRTRNRLPDLEGWEPVWADLRDKLYRFALTNFKDVRAHYQSVEGNGTRIGELWRPMQAVLLALRVEQREIEEIRLLFTAGAEEGRHELDGWESSLFDVLRQKAEEGMDAFKMTGADILKAMDIQGESKPGNPWVGSALSRFSLVSGISKREYVDGRKQKVKVYPFNSTHIFKMYEIYMRDTPLNDMSHMSQAENNNDSNGSHGTGIKHETSPNVSQMADPDNLGQGETCPSEKGCPTEPIEFIANYDVGPVGQAKKEDMGPLDDCIIEEAI
jgi:DNA primase